MAVHEECGVFGIISPRREAVAEIVYYGLYALQHRGQESCGIVVNDDGIFSSYKDLGLVNEVFSKECKNTYFIQTLGDFNPECVNSVRSVGITAGASTPNQIIEEVHTNVRIKF